MASRLLLPLFLLLQFSSAQTPSPSPTMTPTPSATSSLSSSPSQSPTPTPSLSSPTQSPSPTPSLSSPTQSPSPTPSLSSPSQSPSLLSQTATPSRSPTATPSATRTSRGTYIYPTASSTPRPSPVPSPTGAIVGWSFLAFFSTWAFLIILTFGGSMVRLCESVALSMCWAGAVPAMLGRSLGVWLGSLVLHCALLPLENAALFAVGLVMGVTNRGAELGLLGLRVFLPNARTCCFCYTGRGGKGGKGKGALPRYALPPGFPPVSPPAHRYTEGPPPPWWRDTKEGEAAFKRGVEACCIKPCAYNDDGFFTYPCCPQIVGKGLTLFSWLGVYLLIYGLQSGLAVLLLIPIAAAASAFLSSFLYIPAGCCSVFISCFQWEGHLYTVIPRVAERSGLLLGGRAMDAVALLLSFTVFAPVFCMGVMVTPQRPALMSWAATWMRTLRTGDAIPPLPSGEGEKWAKEEGAMQQQQQWQQQHVMTRLELPVMQPGQTITVTTGSGRNLFVHSVQTFYAPLGIAPWGPSYGSNYAPASIWNYGGGNFPPPSWHPPPPTNTQVSTTTTTTSTSSSSSSFMPMPRLPSWRGTMPPPPPLSTSPIPPPATCTVGQGSSPESTLTGAAMPPNPLVAALMGEGASEVGGVEQCCQGCNAPFKGPSFTVCTAPHRVCSTCYTLNLLQGNLGDHALPSARTWEGLLECPWGGGKLLGRGGPACSCTLTAQQDKEGGGGGAQGVCKSPTTPFSLKRLHSALVLREAAAGAAPHGLVFKACTRTTGCAGVLYSLLDAPGIEAMPVWSVCAVCGENEPAVVVGGGGGGGDGVEEPVTVAPVVVVQPPQQVPQWPNFLFSVGELPFTLPQGMLKFVAAPTDTGEDF